MEKQKIQKVYKLMVKANNLNLDMKDVEKQIRNIQEKLFGEKLSDAVNEDKEYQYGLAGVGGYSNGELDSFEEFEKIVNRIESEEEDKDGK